MDVLISFVVPAAVLLPAPKDVAPDVLLHGIDECGVWDLSSHPIRKLFHIESGGRKFPLYFFSFFFFSHFQHSIYQIWKQSTTSSITIKEDHFFFLITINASKIECKIFLLRECNFQIFFHFSYFSDIFFFG
jgi:hypothetical protein